MYTHTSSSVFRFNRRDL